MGLFTESPFSTRNAEVIFISVVGGALGNAMWSYVTTEVDWIGEQRGELLAVGLALITGGILWSNRKPFTDYVGTNLLGSLTSGAEGDETKSNWKTPAVIGIGILGTLAAFGVISMGN